MCSADATNATADGTDVKWAKFDGDSTAPNSVEIPPIEKRYLEVPSVVIGGNAGDVPDEYCL